MTFLLSELAEITGSELQGNPNQKISSVADLNSASEFDITFLANAKYNPLLDKTKAGAICISKETPLVQGKNYLISENPSRTFQKIAETFLGKRKTTGFHNIHPSAIIHETAKVDPTATISPYAVIDMDVTIGPNTFIGPFVSIGTGTTIGKDCYLYAHSVVREYCILQDRVILQPGAIIGSCGFGYTTNDKGEHTKLEQIGNVILENDVEIGANTTIDRARFKTTRIAEGSKIDNLVQIAHNVEIGKHNILAAQTGIAGSSTTGRNVMMGGQVGIVGHVHITDFTMIATRGGVSKDLKEPNRYAGSPVDLISRHNKAQVHIRKLDSYVKRIKILEEKLQFLEKNTISERLNLK